MTYRIETTIVIETCGSEVRITRDVDGDIVIRQSDDTIIFASEVLTDDFLAALGDL